MAHLLLGFGNKKKRAQLSYQMNIKATLSQLWGLFWEAMEPTEHAQTQLLQDFVSFCSSDACADFCGILSIHCKSRKKESLHIHLKSQGPFGPQLVICRALQMTSRDIGCNKNQKG